MISSRVTSGWARAKLVVLSAKIRVGLAEMAPAPPDPLSTRTVSTTASKSQETKASRQPILASSEIKLKMNNKNHTATLNPIVKSIPIAQETLIHQINKKTIATIHSIEITKQMKILSRNQMKCHWSQMNPVIHTFKWQIYPLVWNYEERSVLLMRGLQISTRVMRKIITNLAHPI